MRPWSSPSRGWPCSQASCAAGAPIQVNIQIMRAFTRLRQMLSGYAELRNKIEKMEEKYDQNFQVVFEAIKQLLEVEARPKRKIGFTGEKRVATKDSEGTHRKA